MTQLKVLRRQLSTLRRRRRAVRWLTAYSALLSAIIWAAVGVFAVDFLFSKSLQVALDGPQRIIVMVIAASGLFAAFYVFTRPLIGVRETNEDMALLVERNQQIDSDLIAALQFESPDAGAWGSRQLEVAVISYVGRACRSLNVFQGFDIDQMVRRAVLLLVSVAVIVGLHAALPQHMQVFWRRLALSAEHYPTKTQIQRVSVNHHTVLVRRGYAAAPDDTRSPQGQPLVFTVLCRGTTPGTGKVKLTSAGQGPVRESELELQRIDDDERLTRLRDGLTRIDKAIADPSIDVKGPWQRELVGLTGFDAPLAASLLQQVGQDRSQLAAARKRLAEAVSSWNPDGRSSLYVATLDRLVEPFRYSIFLGDAWTDPAHVRMIPLPVVELDYDVAAPEYARGLLASLSKSSTSHISVLEGSQIQFSLECSNRKRLVDAWMNVQHGGQSLRLPLTAADDSGVHWTLAVADTPFAEVTGDLRYELQVEDEDGLHLAAPLRGQVRAARDRAPSATIHWVHKLALPSARLLLQYNVRDDFGVEQMVVHAQVEPGGERRSSEDPRTSSAAPHAAIPLAMETPLLKPVLPYQGQYRFDLSQLQLQKGDRVKVELEVVDYRGAKPGKSARSDSLVLEITDESGVLAAVSQADERSEKQLNEIIKRQLGIGESP